VPEKNVVLAVDDEKQLLGLLADYLERLRYEVRACGSAEEALAVFREEPDAFSVALVDHQLSGMNGEELVAELRKLNPQLGVVMLSGYAWKPEEEAGGLPGRTRFLQKPFAPAELARLIESLCAR
jgi:CheY-like chemotaxis protein